MDGNEQERLYNFTPKVKEQSFYVYSTIHSYSRVFNKRIIHNLKRVENGI